MVLLPEEVGEKGFLESIPLRSEIDSSRKRHAGGPFLEPGWKQKAEKCSGYNVVVFSEGWDFPIDHIDAILKRNIRLVVRPAECELTQDGVEYRGHVVELGKWSPAQLKVRAIIDFQISRNKTEVKVLGVAGYDRQYIPICSCLVAPFTESLKRKSEKGNIRGTSERAELFRQLKENLLTNSVLYAPDFMERFILQPETIFFCMQSNNFNLISVSKKMYDIQSPEKSFFSSSINVS
ncbi:retrovirus-related Pol polyprotein from transposon 297 [Trichonephila clavipes]|nr:retrovirus-related Pol polyprotein from transposon 297 [Trichonephila clavipes]